jgi:hypothetical protein
MQENAVESGKGSVRCGGAPWSSGGVPGRSSAKCGEAPVSSVESR